LAEIGKLTTLRSLNLETTGVTDQGMRNLARLVNLEDLSLFGTKVGDQGLAQLKGLTKPGRLD
jgi:hypothetical protein